MTNWDMTEEPTAFEPIPVLDTFVTGMLPPEEHGGVVRLTLIADRLDGRGASERTIVARIVMGKDGAASDLTRRLLQHIGQLQVN